jgi:hypothetical protein
VTICKKCGREFPTAVKIGGVWKNISKRVFCLECSPWGMHNTKDLTKIKTNTNDTEKECARCHKVFPITEFYICSDGARHSWCRDCIVKAIGERRIVRKKMAIEYLGGKCQKCGYDRNPAALEFHHRDGSEKEETINKLLRGSFKRVMEELDKCDLLCANCHRELHHPLT